MSEDNQNGNDEVEQLTQEEIDARMDQGPSRLDALKQRAKALGINHSPNIGEDTLATKIEEFLSKDEDEDKPKEKEYRHPKADIDKIPSLEVILQMTSEDILGYPEHLRTRILRAKQRHECLKLIRCQIHNNNPAKNDLHGEILSVGNKYVGTVRKYIPFGEKTENGYHIPKILFDMIKNRKYQRVKSIKNPDGTERVDTTLAPEFTLTILDPLTKEELNELKLRQEAVKAAGF